MPPALSPAQHLRRAAHLWKAVTQDHHRPLAPVLGARIPADGVVFDVGAHAGQFAKLFARLAPQGRVFAFEPAAYARSILGAVVQLRRLRQVEILPLALGDQLQTLTLSTPLKRAGALGFGLAHLGAASGPARQEPVRVTTLDAFVAERGLQRLDFLKADIEGHEGRLLAGARASLARFRPALLLELDAARLARAGDAPGPILANLVGLGYRAQRLFPDGALEPVETIDAPGDFLFDPPGPAT